MKKRTRNSAVRPARATSGAEPLAKRSRAIFHKLHIAQNKDDAIFERLAGLLSPEYLGVPKQFFNGKLCLDAGCGSTGNATYAMLALGAGHVEAVDVDASIKTARTRLAQAGFSNFTLRAADILDLPYPDNHFDFVHCSGVLHHTADPYRGLAELARVTKKGGMLYIMVYGSGGIMREVTTLLREKYARDPAFKREVDRLSGKRLHAMWRWVVGSMSAHGDDLGTRVPASLAESLFNEDLALTIKDRIQAPVYHEMPEQELRAWFSENGFTRVKRHRRYPKQNNIRRFLAPLYDAYEHPLARLFYGDGTPQMSAIKK